jgi:hypothetical protein
MEAGGKVEDRVMMETNGMGTEIMMRRPENGEVWRKVEDRGNMEATGIMETEIMLRRPKE